MNTPHPTQPYRAAMDAEIVHEAIQDARTRPNLRQAVSDAGEALAICRDTRRAMAETSDVIGLRTWGPLWRHLAGITGDLRGMIRWAHGVDGRDKLNAASMRARATCATIALILEEHGLDAPVTDATPTPRP